MRWGVPLYSINSMLLFALKGPNPWKAELAVSILSRGSLIQPEIAIHGEYIVSLILSQCEPHSRWEGEKKKHPGQIDLTTADRRRCCVRRISHTIFLGSAKRIIPQKTRNRTTDQHRCDVSGRISADLSVLILHILLIRGLPCLLIWVTFYIL